MSQVENDIDRIGELAKGASKKSDAIVRKIAQRAVKSPDVADGSTYRNLLRRAMASEIGDDTPQDSDAQNNTDQPQQRPQTVNINQAVTGQEYLQEALKDNVFKDCYEKLGALLALLKIHLRPSNKPLNQRESILTNRGFNKEIVIKYLLGLFGGFGNPDMKTETGIRALLEERERETDEERGRKGYKAIICNEVLQLQRCGGNVGEIMGKFNELKARMLRLNQLWALDDITDIHRIAMTIGVTELEQKKWLSHEDQLRALGITDRVDPQDRYAALAEDLAKLDRMIAENQGNVPHAGNMPQNPPNQPQQNPAQAVNVGTQGVDLTEIMREALNDQELLISINALNGLFAWFRDPNLDTFDLSLEINATGIANGNLGSAMDVANNDNILQFLADYFNLRTNAELAEKTKEIYAELHNRNIL